MLTILMKIRLKIRHNFSCLYRSDSVFFTGVDVAFITTQIAFSSMLRVAEAIHHQYDDKPRRDRSFCPNACGRLT